MFSEMFVCPQGSFSLCLGGGSVKEGALSRGSLFRWVSVQGGLCPQGDVSVQGVSVQGGSLSRESLSGRPPVQ